VSVSCKLKLHIFSWDLVPCSDEPQMLNAIVSVNTASYLHASQHIRAVSRSESVLLKFLLCRFDSLPLSICSEIRVKLPYFPSNVVVATLEPWSTLGDLELPHILQPETNTFCTISSALSAGNRKGKWNTRF
jgi:hypothetical protein